MRATNRALKMQRMLVGVGVRTAGAWSRRVMVAEGDAWQPYLGILTMVDGCRGSTRRRRFVVVPFLVALAR
jgi:hypothetical protein